MSKKKLNIITEAISEKKGKDISDFERYNLVYDDIDGYVYYSPMKYSITVEHDCEEEEPEENVQTFDLPIFIVWGVGGAALIYSIYYFTKYYKSQKENV